LSLYEGMFVMDNRQANRDWDGSLEKLKGIFTKHGAQIRRCDKWGERKLAYEMQGRRRGTYVLTYFDATGTAANEIYRECELSELMMRALILKVDAIPPEEQLRAPEEYSPRRPRMEMHDDFRRGRPRERREPDARPPAGPAPEAAAPEAQE